MTEPATAAGRTATACTVCSASIRECRKRRVGQGDYCCRECEHFDVPAIVEGGRIVLDL